MKNTLLFMSFTLFMTLFSSCGSNKELQENPPSEVTDSFFYETDNGMRLSFQVAEIPADIQYQSVYFRGLKSNLIADPNGENIFHADFNTKMNDMVMHKDPKKEYGNTPPQRPEKSPVEITPNEALLVYTKDGDQKYYKLTGIVEKE
ncbi:hypothetical protein [Gramella sp. AN32]|uniref:Lipoprotein n=1 Tax=Christiangramia antarctica TaxID=2058158 RepID=A0ABW5WZS7_9FLAO|nr:hypothetical protein [Gramella sp. AN32]MCM4155040.1 hypothetical protein [Gramella sp. AN32]